ncbi:MAG TPA: hypothetical protein VJZ75_04900 [Candidatus Bathyarchaeia archaeon]|nr:hypothetical protein [Candidatus Bathyarchaeia archaeon]
MSKRISQDHGVTVLEKDVIETLEKLKAANKEKITGAEQAPVTPPVTQQTPEVSPITGANNMQKVAEQPPAPLPTGSEQPPNTLPTGSSTPPAPLPAGSSTLSTGGRSRDTSGS